MSASLSPFLSAPTSPSLYLSVSLSSAAPFIEAWSGPPRRRFTGYSPSLGYMRYLLRFFLSPPLLFPFFFFFCLLGSSIPFFPRVAPPCKCRAPSRSTRFLPGDPVNRGYVEIGQREQRRGISISAKVWLFSYRGQELVIFYWLDRNSVVFDRFDPVWVCCWGIIALHTTMRTMFADVLEC